MDSEEILEDSPDENNLDYDPEKDIEDSETDSITSLEIVMGSVGEQSCDDSAPWPPSPNSSASHFILLSDPFAVK